MSAVLSSPARPARGHDRAEPLENGERLAAPEFLRRYEAVPELKKAELIEGGRVLNARALLARDGASALATLNAALKRQAHRKFVTRLNARKSIARK